MPVFIEELHSTVQVETDELPLTPAQVERLVEIVIARLDARDRERQDLKDASAIVTDMLPPLKLD